MHWLRLTNLIVLIHVLVGGTLVLLEDGGDPVLPHALHLSIRTRPGADEVPFTSRGVLHTPAYGAAPVQPLLAHPPLPDAPPLGQQFYRLKRKE